MPKSFAAVFHPERFPPMPEIRSLTDFEQKWNANRAAVLANISHAAYLDEAELKKLIIGRSGARDLYFFDQRGAQAFLAVWPDKAILAFRGSQLKETPPDAGDNSLVESLKKLLLTGFDPKSWQFLGNDLLADLNFRKKAVDETSSVKVHSGFLREVDKLWEDILTRLKQQPAGMPVWVTGHSLGAAMATISGLRYPFEAVVTFGEPRVGYRLERAFQAKQHIRYVNGDDPVTKVPPETGFGFIHHGESVTIRDSDGSTDFRYDHAIVYYAQNLLNGFQPQVND